MTALLLGGGHIDDHVLTVRSAAPDDAGAVSPSRRHRRAPAPIAMQGREN
jgi:hypothetical protein